MLELEHATVSKMVEWEGQMLDVIPGMGSGWEPALYALDLHLLGTLPDAPAAQWQSGKPSPELEQLIDRSVRAWTALVDDADRAGRNDTTSPPKGP